MLYQEQYQNIVLQSQKQISKTN